MFTAMPKMSLFLENNGPWSQLIQEKNIQINKLKNDSIQTLSKYISIKPILVPHRDEFSETVGYLIKGDANLLYSFQTLINGKNGIKK